MQVLADLSRQLADVTGTLDGMTGKMEAVTVKLEDTTDELEALRALLTVRLVNREECARIAGVSSRTVQRYEVAGLIEPVSKKGKKAFYEYTDAVRLKKLFKK